LGQWQNGMVMISDMFNNSLKNKVNNLCVELSTIIKQEFTVGNKPVIPSLLGKSNETSYAYYQDANILELQVKGVLKTYDTTGYIITGVQQSQSNNIQNIILNHTKGTINILTLKKNEIRIK
jgi:hypothetical protein